MYLDLALLARRNVRELFVRRECNIPVLTTAGICHAGGAALLQQKKDLMLIKDMGPNSVYYQYTTVSLILRFLVSTLTSTRLVG